MARSVNISIALATFNGEDYLPELLKSLNAQSHLPAEVVVGDDGSSDGTVAILKGFRREAKFDLRIFENDVNIGYSANFLKTAKRCKGNWVAFCDQDDVWLPNKLQNVKTAIELNPTLNMILQNAWLASEDLTSRGVVFPNFKPAGVYDDFSMHGFWVWPGFLKTIRRDLLLIGEYDVFPASWRSSEPRLTHDKWTCILANVVGGILVQKPPVAMYRRHPKTVTGSFEKQSLATQISKANKTTWYDYERQEVSAREISLYLRDIHVDVESKILRSALLKGSLKYEELSHVLALRRKLYQSVRPSVRASSFLEIWKRNGYFGDKFLSLGVRSAMKDLGRVGMGAWP